MGNYYETFNPPFFLTKWSSFSPLKINHNSYNRNDGEIITDLNTRFAEITKNLHGISCEDITVSCIKQSVTLSGTVATNQIKRYVENVALQTFGIRDVINLLEIPRAGASRLETQTKTVNPTTNLEVIDIKSPGIDLPN